ncbi:MAG: SDR family NAD(P)-dependent oxidoreductase [Gemmatimonadetes bacterium]|nr:SDR family NAD(P)-dependent oxidoreductase [Gemmatimonadota bacterium]
MDLSGRCVLLTGGSRGIGPVIAEALARRGAHLALTARSEEGLHRTLDALRPHGVRTIAIPADLAHAAERERVVARVLDEFGRVDVLLNNAGLETEGAFVELPWERLAETIEVNLTAPVHLTHLLLPQMLTRSQGHVVHVSSLAGKAAIPYAAMYSGTKAALARWSDGLRREIGASGVRISTVFPGFVTEQGMFARSGMQPPRLLGSCTPAQVAAAVVEAIESGRSEVVVNSLPVRPVVALGELFPSFADWALRRLGVTELQRRKVGAPPP